MKKKYRVIIALNFDVKANDENNAEEIAIEKLEQEFGEKFTDIVLNEFGINVVECD
jgi:hypothetical protein